LHNGLWAPLAHGAAGTGALWWWGQYVDPKDLYFHFLPVAKFTAGIPWTTAGFRQARVEAGNDQIRVLGLRGRPLSILWVQNRKHTWGNVVAGTPIPVIEGAQLTLSDLERGRYKVEYWDTWTGAVTGESELAAPQGTVRIPIPPLQRDIALKIFRIKR
jgi:hypothetical protein